MTAGTQGTQEGGYWAPPELVPGVLALLRQARLDGMVVIDGRTGRPFRHWSEAEPWRSRYLNGKDQR